MRRALKLKRPLYRRTAAFGIPKTPATLDYLPEDRAKAPISYDIP
ncbi:hypothetical protein ABID59_004514 [Bradyrhizobium sp. S3.3.6]|nr:hypothetical protein [Bradyrhizobium rifense]